MIFDAECLGKDGRRRRYNFKYVNENGHIVYFLNNEKIIQREVLSFQLISLDDDTLKVSDMYIDDLSYREKGIVEAIIINLSKHLDKTIASSTRFQGGNEHLHEPAKKVWDRLVSKGFAFYDENIGRYKTIKKEAI